MNISMLYAKSILENCFVLISNLKEVNEVMSVNNIKQNLLSVYEDMTAVERSIADFFLNNGEMLDFSAKNITKLLYISDATLSRFAKKCNYKGYREFIYLYEKELQEELNERNISVLTKRVKYTYSTLMEESFNMLDEKKVKRVSDLMNSHSRVCVCGMGSSGYSAREIQLRFMRLGMNIQAVTDSQMIQMSTAILDENCLLLAISLSGKTKEIIDALKMAKGKGASVVLITSEIDVEGKDNCDEVLYVATAKNLDAGMKISPQFPILILVDVLYMYYFENDANKKMSKYRDTLSALQGGKANNKREKK
ncbi:MurR/RpiR family transcriptional regulator [Cellulosilyticum sp. WCF-2]|nr:MurR/RpiR family transcriptional regulator [Cellulosilyticum sp. WCF-2]